MSTFASDIAHQSLACGVAYLTGPGMQPLGCQEAVHELDRDRALSDRRGDALDGTMPHVARREDTRHARLEQQRAGRRRWFIVGPLEIRAGEQEALAVSRYLFGQPIGPRAGTDQDEKAVGGDSLVLSGRTLTEFQVLESP